MSDTEATISFAALLLALLLWVVWTINRDAKHTVEEFIRMFPGRCFVCAYHRWEVMEGHASGAAPRHDCIERGEHRREEEK